MTVAKEFQRLIEWLKKDMLDAYDDMLKAERVSYETAQIYGASSPEALEEFMQHRYYEIMFKALEKAYEEQIERFDRIEKMMDAA